MDKRLAQEVLQYVIDHPEQHDQQKYFCGTKACLGVEGKYANAYQRLVRLGVAPQIRLKYRQS